MCKAAVITVTTLNPIQLESQTTVFCSHLISDSSATGFSQEQFYWVSTLAIVLCDPKVLNPKPFDIPFIYCDA